VPQGGSPEILTGDEAQKALANERRRSVSRRQLERNESFANVSPELGELNAEAFEQLVEDDVDSALELLSQMAQATDSTLAKLARRLAGRLVLDMTRSGPARARGTGKLLLAAASTDSHDIDIDASLDSIVAARAEVRPVGLDELTATQWKKPGTAVCLLIDRSGSMNGSRLACAALAAAMCSWRAPAEFSVIAFGSRAVTIKGLNEVREPEAVVADVLTLRGHGTTDVALALRAAATQLESSNASRKVTLLLSDAESTVGDDPVGAGLLLPELSILAPEEDAHHAESLATATGARLATVTTPMSVIGALQRLVD